MADSASQRSRSLLYPLTLAATAAASGAAWGQSSPSAVAAPPAAASDTVSLEEIYVTANRRLEKAKDVAGSVNVLGGQQLEQFGVTSIEEVAGYVPGFQVIGNSPGLKRQSIRGITTGSQQIGASVATYMDEQPISLSTSIIGGAALTNDIDPLDLERIEVLKGPQGSLYGASALGGLVKYVTVSPDVEQFEGRAEVGYTSGRGDSGHTARAAVNVPIAKDVFAVRVTAYTHEDPGYVEDKSRGRKDLNAFKHEGARLTALLLPGARFDAKLVLDTQTLESDDAAVPDYDAATLQPVYGNYAMQRPFAQPVKNTFDRAALTLNYDLGFASLLSVTSYAHIENSYGTDYSSYLKYLDYATVAAFAAAGFPVPSLNPSAANYRLAVDTEKKVQELRLTSPGGGSFDWLAGAFFQEEKTLADVTLDVFSGSDLSTPSARYLEGDVRAKLRESAAYANATYRFSDSFDLQAGVRYTSLSQDYYAAQAVYNYLAGVPVALPANATNSKEKQTTWLLSPRWTLSDNDMIYFRAASGYRPGGPNVPDTLGQVKAPLESDSIINYEIGYKGILPSANLDVSATLFRIDWKDIQVTATDATSGAAYYANGGKARSQGLELELGWRPLQGLRLSAMLSAMQAELTEDVPAVNGLDGDDIPFTPKVSGTLATDYSWPFGSNQLSLGATLRHVGERQVVFSNQSPAPFVPTIQAPELPAYEVLDLRASFNRNRWTVSLFVKNALNERVPITYSATLVALDPMTGLAGPATVGVTAPRTIGALLRADF